MGKKDGRWFAHYYIESPHVDYSNGKQSPLMSFAFYTCKKVVTKTGKVGKAVVCELSLGDIEIKKHAVCCPPDKFVFEYGAKLALTRALANRLISKETRAQAWNGFYTIIDPKGKSRERIRQRSS